MDLKVRRIINNQLIESIFLGVSQILLWGNSYFMIPILGSFIVKETGWSSHFIYSCFSISILISGLISPKVGKKINQLNHNYILLWSGIVMALGLFILSFSYHKITFILGWFVVGLGMGFGLYDALFASLGKKYGKNASVSIVQITLISGFATTIIWPLMAFINEEIGWRLTLIFY